MLELSKDLQMTTKKVVHLSKELADIQQRAFTVFSLSNFQEQKRNEEEFYSPPFYTSNKGYKICMRVLANGADGGEGTHVSVYACLMKGDNDDSLTWPFTGTVTVELLNQLEDENHHKEAVTFEEWRISSRRVVGEKSPFTYGIPQFLSHTDLHYQPDKNCQYLKDDTLVFRVSTSDYKPWLQCTI